MNLTPQTPPHPSGDKRFKLLDVAIKRHQFRQDALIEVLHTAQELFGFLDSDVLVPRARAEDAERALVALGFELPRHVDRMLVPDETLMRPRIEIHVRSDAEPMQRVRPFLARDHRAHHVLRRGAVGTADAAREELVLAVGRHLGGCGLAAVAGETPLPHVDGYINKEDLIDHLLPCIEWHLGDR